MAIGWVCCYSRIGPSHWCHPDAAAFTSSDWWEPCVSTREAPRALRQTWRARDQASVMLVLDISGSMAARDIQPTRLGAAQQVAKQLIASLPSGAQVGVVAFSDRAFVADPLSADPSTAQRALDQLQPGGGTAIGDGLNLAPDQLMQ